MPNVTSILKQEISRVARKEIRGAMKGIIPLLVAAKRANSGYKKRITQLEAKIAKQEKLLGGRDGIKLPKPEQLEHSRLGAKNVAKLRKKLDLTRAEMAKLIGASANSIFLWENGKAAPRAAAKAKIIALRSLGKRAIKKLLGEVSGKDVVASGGEAKPSSPKRRKAKAAKPAEKKDEKPAVSEALMQETKPAADEKKAKPAVKSSKAPKASRKKSGGKKVAAPKAPKAKEVIPSGSEKTAESSVQAEPPK